MNRIVIILIMLLSGPALYAQYGEEQEERGSGYADVLRKYEFPFRSITEDSINILAEKGEMGRLGGDGISERSHYDDLYLLKIDNEAYIAVKYNHSWKISVNGFWDAGGLSYSVYPYNLDDEGVYELKVESYGSNGRGGRYDGYDEYAGDNWLVNVDKEYVMYLRGIYHSEYHSYTGYREVGDDEADYQREDEEYGNEENFEHGIDEDNCEIRIEPARVVFEDISCTSCDGILDSVFAIEYILRNDTLFKGNIHPQFRNLAELFGYKVLKGRVGKYPVTTHLTKNGDNYSSYYYYDKYQKQIQLIQNAYNEKDGITIIMEAPSKIFKGELTDTDFSGQWTDGKKTLDFNLQEDYSNGEVRLKAYSFHDSVLAPSGSRYDMRAAYYVADTAAMSKEDALALNKVLFEDRGYQEEVIYSNPAAVFYDFRGVALSDISDNLYTHPDISSFYNDLTWREIYNRNGLLSMTLTNSRYTTGLSPRHTTNTIIYDA